MKKHTILTLVTCALLSAAAISTAQTPAGAAGPGAAAPGGGARGRGGRGGARGPVVPPGPPAPVPPEVAMQRPTPDEVARMNADLKQFMTTSPDKDLFQKYAPQLAVEAPRDNACIRPAP